MKKEVNINLSNFFEKQFTSKLYASAIHQSLRLEQSPTVSSASADFAAVMRGLLAEGKRDDFSVRWRYFTNGDLNIGGTGYDKTFLIYPKTSEENRFYLSSKSNNTLFMLDDKSFGLIASMLACEKLLKRYSVNDLLIDRVKEVLVAYIAIHDAFTVTSNMIALYQGRFDSLERESATALDRAFTTLVDADNQIVEHYNEWGDYQPPTEKHYSKILSYWINRKAS